MTYNHEDMLYNQKQNTLSISQKQSSYNKCRNQTFNHSRFYKNEPKHTNMNLKYKTNQPEINWKCGILTFKNNTHNKNKSKILYKHKSQHNVISNEISTNWSNKWDSDNLFGWKNTRLM